MSQESILTRWSQHRSNPLLWKEDKMCRGPQQKSVWCCSLCSSIAWLFQNRSSLLLDDVEYEVVSHPGCHRATSISSDHMTLDPTTCDATLSNIMKHRAIPKVLLSTWCTQSFQVREKSGISLLELAQAQKGLTSCVLHGIIVQLVIALHELEQQHQFKQYVVTLNDLMFYDTPVDFSYLGVKVECPVTLKFSNLSRSSVVTTEGVKVDSDIPYLSSNKSTTFSDYWAAFCSAGLEDLITENTVLMKIHKVVIENEHDPNLTDLVLKTLQEQENLEIKIN